MKKRDKREPVVVVIKKKKLIDHCKSPLKTQTFTEDVVKTEIKVEVKEEAKPIKEIKGCFKETQRRIDKVWFSTRRE